MPTIRTPDGRRLRVPEGATAEQINSVLQSQGYDVQSGSGTTERGERPSANDSDFARLITGKPAEPTIPQQIGRELGLGARGIIRGAYDLTSLAGGDLINAAESKIRGVPVRSQRENADWLADKLGLPSPVNASERVGSEVTAGLTGGGGLIGLGRQLALRAPGVVQGVGTALASQPATQIAGNVAGTTASNVTREAGGGTGAQVAAGLIGGLSPAAAKTAGSMGLRGLARGGEAGRQQMARTIADFRSVGAEPSVGQATGSRGLQGLESLLAGAPTSAGVVGRFAERQANDIGAGLRSQAEAFTPNASAERAGRAVERGIRGADDQAGFVQNSRKVADDLYRRLDATIPKDTRVDVQSTRAALSDLNSMIDGAPSVSRFFQNARLEGIERGLLSDVAGADAVLTQPGMRENVEAYRQYLQGQAQQVAARNAERQSLGMNVLEPVPAASDIEDNVRKTLGNMVDQRLPYEALQKLRTLVGNEIEGATLASDVPRSKWKALYGALSRDMEAAATTPEAKQALSRANAYYNARIARLDAIDSVVNKNGGPERIFDAAMSGTRDGGTTLRAVMQSLPEDGQRAVTAAVIKRMGMATPGAQDAAGEVFSAQTFLTNWNRVSPEARRALFDRHGPKFAADMDRIARVADNIRTGSKAFANPSGTANKVAAYTYGASLAGSLLTGQLHAAGGLAAAGAIANGLARAMTSPRFVSWLARSTELPVSSLPQQMVILRGIAERDPEVAEFAEALEQSNQGPNQQPR